jgi:cellulose synthase/poly-beta-1,6-N-acetylglucosamine synthase-like glycosyltransferase
MANLISIIIIRCDKNRELTGLLNDIEKQSLTADKEIIRVDAVKPSGKARNQGAAQAQGGILVFLDDDVRLGHDRILADLRETLDDPATGICGASQLLPPDAVGFSRRLARQIPHLEHPVVEENQPVGMVGGGCCALRRAVFETSEGFNEQIPRGVDTEFCARLNCQGHKVILVKNTWIYHPCPGNMAVLIKMAWRDGSATAYVDKFFPGLNYDIKDTNSPEKLHQASLWFRIARYAIVLAVAAVTIKPLLLVYKIFSGLGYVAAFLTARKREQHAVG